MTTNPDHGYDRTIETYFSRRSQISKRWIYNSNIAVVDQNIKLFGLTDSFVGGCDIAKTWQWPVVPTKRFYATFVDSNFPLLFGFPSVGQLKPTAVLSQKPASCFKYHY
jgi:hypothetical protein